MKLGFKSLLLATAFVMTLVPVSMASESFKEKGAKINDECKADVEVHCKGIFGPRNRLTCLMGHQAELSPGCRALVTELEK
jgi:hypothetical protein